MKGLAELLIAAASKRPPDFVIGGDAKPYLKRWWLIPRNRFLNIYLHQFLRSDDDRALHDHPWIANCSWLIDGAYIEWVPGGATRNPLRPVPRFLKAGDVKFRWGPAPHRVQLHMIAGREVPCWTLFVTGPRVREWFFHCPQGPVHWRDFTDKRDSGAIGKGCNQ